MNLIKSFGDIFNMNIPLAIHKSQRPYIWDTDKVKRLIEDLEEFNDRCNTKGLTDLPYYMGTIVMFKNTEGKNQLEIIDGQQRITTLLLFDYIANKANAVIKCKPESVVLEFNSNISIQNIRKIKDLLEEEDISLRLSFLKDVIKDRLVFTLVVVTDEDEAFTYFDTQNNRGKKPGIDVVLKAVHLRAIPGNEELQKICAEKWETVERYFFHGILIPGHHDSFLYPLLKHILWRSRTWKFSNASFSNESKIENIFSRNLSLANDNTITFYDGTKAISDGLGIVDGDITETLKMIDSDMVRYLPFQLRQPLTKGLTFFIFLEKYALCYKQLFSEENAGCTEQIKEFKLFYNKIYSAQSQYMKQYYTLCMMMYYDKFEETRLLDFARTLDYLIGAERIAYYYIFDVKFLNINNRHNLLDAIQMAYTPDEVIEFIISNPEIETKKVVAVNKVITDYLYELKHYYEGGKRKNTPHKITTTPTSNAGEVYKGDLINELNVLVKKRKRWLLQKMNSYA